MKYKRSTLVAALMLALGLTTVAAGAVPVSTTPGTQGLTPATGGLTDPQELEAFLDAVIAEQMATDHIPGATVSVVKDSSSSSPRATVMPTSNAKFRWTPQQR